MLLPLTRADEINLLTYLYSSMLIVWATDHYRRLIKRLQDEEGFRKLAVEELAHRLKNKLATIQAIVNFRLREHPHVRDEIAGALTALTATDDLITAAQGQGAHIGDILSTELAPYDLSRISMDGPDCLLSPKLALTMALLVHELATNAAKYGALSSAAGKLAIDWTLSDTRLSSIGVKPAARRSARQPIAVSERGYSCARSSSSADKSMQHLRRADWSAK